MMKGLVTTSDFLVAYSEGKIGPEKAMEGIGVYTFRELLNAMADNGHPLPRGRGRETEVEREVAEVLPILLEAFAQMEAKQQTGKSVHLRRQTTEGGVHE